MQFSLILLFLDEKMQSFYIPKFCNSFYYMQINTLDSRRNISRILLSELYFEETFTKINGNYFFIKSFHPHIYKAFCHSVTDVTCNVATLACIVMRLIKDSHSSSPKLQLCKKKVCFYYSQILFWTKYGIHYAIH